MVLQQILKLERGYNMSENMVPSETIELPSKGWYYPESNPLSKGHIDMFYMCARHEDLLTSRTLIEKGTVIERLLQELIVDKTIKIDDMLLGDKNGLMIAARIMGYGKDYPVTVNCPKCSTENETTINLETIEPTKINFTKETKGKNEFIFTLPVSKKVIVFQLPTQGSDAKIRDELRMTQKAIKSDISHEVTTRMRHAIVSINGNTDAGFIRTEVDNMIVRDSRAFREFAQTISPDIDMSSEFICKNCTYDGRVEVPVNANFFWPNARI